MLSALKYECIAAVARVKDAKAASKHRSRLPNRIKDLSLRCTVHALSDADGIKIGAIYAMNTVNAPGSRQPTNSGVRLIVFFLPKYK